VNQLDSMSNTRTVVLLQGAMLLQSIQDQHPELVELTLEIVRFIFLDPHYNTKIIKGMLSPISQCVCACSTSGSKIDWNIDGIDKVIPQISGYGVSLIVANDNDFQSYLAMKERLDESFALMRDHRLNLLYDWALFAIHGAPEMVIPQWVQIRSVWACAGFTRTEQLMSHKEHAGNEILADKDAEYVRVTLDPIGEYKKHGEKDEGDLRLLLHDRAPYRLNLKEEWSKFAEWAMKTNNLPSWNDIRRNLPFLLTSRAASVSAKVSIDLPLRGSRMSIRINNKRQIFFLQGEKALDYKSYMQSAYVDDHPGRIGSRDTVGRVRRAIFMIVMNDFCYETFIAEPLMSYMIMGKHTNPRFSLSDNTDMTPGAATGILLADHGLGAYYSGRGSHLIWLADYSHFDMSQKFMNCRSHCIDALCESFQKLGYTAPLGPFEQGYPAYIRQLWGESRRVHAKFISKTSYAEEIIDCDLLLSGEFVTIHFNGMTNRALFVTLLSLLRDRGLMTNIRMTVRKFQGDDNFAIFDILNKHLLTADYLKQLAQSSCQISALSGFELNQYKVGLRRFRYEYLKVEFIYGFHVPLQHMQLFSTERPRVAAYPTEFLGSWRAKLASMVCRGFSSRLAVRVNYYSWALFRLLKFRKLTQENRILLPMCYLFVPQRHGGGGSLPWTVIGASVDAMVVEYAKENPVFNDYVSRASYMITMGSTSSRADEITEELVKTHFKPGINFMKSVIPPEVVSDARSARTELEKHDIKLGRLYVEQHPEDIAFMTSANIGEVKTIRDSSRSDVGLAYLAHFPMSGIRKLSADYKWVWATRLKFGPEITPILPEVTPFAFMHKTMRAAYGAYGVGTENDIADLHPEAQFAAMRRSNYAPRHLTPARILGEITKGKYAMQPTLMVSALVAMGFDPTRATLFLDRLTKNLRLWALYNVMDAFSFADNFLSNMEICQNTLDRVVPGFKSMGFPHLSLMQYLAFLKSVFWGLRDGRFNSMRVDVDNEVMSEYNSAMKEAGSIIPEAAVLNHLYGEKEDE